MISIVIPLYNYARYILENIEYIKNQSLSDWEIIIVDDMSSDNPFELIKDSINDKIKYVSISENLGYGNAKNVGIRMSVGDYIVVLDADDLLCPTSLEDRLEHLNKSKSLWIHAKALEFSGDTPYTFITKKRKAVRRLKHILKTKDYTNLWENIHAQTVMAHRSVYEKVGLYETSLRSMGDKEMWHRIINNIGIPAFLDKPVVYYRQHRMQMHRSKDKKDNLKKYMKILDKCIKRNMNLNLSFVERL